MVIECQPFCEPESDYYAEDNFRSVIAVISGSGHHFRAAPVFRVQTLAQGAYFIHYQFTT